MGSDGRKPGHHARNLSLVQSFFLYACTDHCETRVKTRVQIAPGPPGEYLS